MLKGQTGHWLYMVSHSHRQRRQPAVAQAIYRTTEAALANVERHAGATQVTVKLTATGTAVALSLCDDCIQAEFAPALPTC